MYYKHHNSYLPNGLFKHKLDRRFDKMSIEALEETIEKWGVEVTRKSYKGRSYRSYKRL